MVEQTNEELNFFEKYQRDHTHPINHVTHMIGIPMIVVSLPLFIFKPWIAGGLFVLGWIFQFIGHAYEGKPPTFLSDPRALIAGPMFVVQKIYKAITASKRQA